MGYELYMPAAPNAVFSSLADPTRRAIFERLCREGELTVRALTEGGRVSPAAVSKHLRVLKQAGLVRAGAKDARRITARGLTGSPPIDWTSQMAGFWRDVRRPRRPIEEDGPMTDPETETRTVVVEREMPYPAEKIWRALTQPHLIEEWLMKNDFTPQVGHRFNLRGDWGGVLDCEVLEIEPKRTLSYTWNFAHADAAYNLKSVVTFTLTPTQHRHPPAHGAVGLPAGSEAGLRGRQGGVAAVLREAGSGFVARGLKPAGCQV